MPRRPSEDADPRIHTLDLLLTAEGQTLLAELAREPSVSGDELRLVTKYRARYDKDLVQAALAQAKLRLRARAKFTKADAMYFTQDGLEQASTERMARYHADQFARFDALADFCTGIGGDLIGLAADRPVLAVDLDPVHLRMAVLNAGAYGIAHHVQSQLADVTRVAGWGYGTGPEKLGVFIDPARRSEGGRLARGESSPPLEWCFELGKVAPVMVKAGPALPLDRVAEGWGIEFVSEGRELKEALLSSPGMDRQGRRATILGSGSVTLSPQLGEPVVVKAPGRFLLDPDPAVTRAGLVEDLARQLHAAWKIDEEVAFLSADQPTPTPFGRWLEAEASLPWNLNRLKEALRGLDVGSVDIRKRGSAVDVEEIQRRLKLTGSRPATVVLTRVGDQPWAFVCTGVRDSVS